VGADAPECVEDHTTAVRQPPDPYRTILCVERNRYGMTTGSRHNLVFNVDALGDAAAFPPARRAYSLLCCRDTVDREQPEGAEQVLVVDPAKRGVVDDALGARDQGSETPEAVHRDRGLRPWLLHRDRESAAFLRPCHGQRP
jgi:hypothetical protein